jgi:hypothetical protein
LVSSVCQLALMDWGDSEGWGWNPLCAFLLSIFYIQIGKCDFLSLQVRCVSRPGVPRLLRGNSHRDLHCDATVHPATLIFRVHPLP